jgi:hypothetical protein
MVKRICGIGIAHEPKHPSTQQPVSDLELDYNQGKIPFFLWTPIILLFILLFVGGVRHFRPTPQDCTEAELMELLSVATQDDIFHFVYDDFDGDGAHEAFALTYPSGDANIWYVSPDGAELVMTAGNAGWLSNTPIIAENHKFMVLLQCEPSPTFYFAKHYLFTVNDGACYQPSISGEDGFFGNNSQEDYNYETPVYGAFYSCTWRAYGATGLEFPWENITYYDFDENTLEFQPSDE